jgi:predicted esterase
LNKQNGLMQSWDQGSMQYTLPVRYLVRGPKNLGTVVLLHGYQDHAMSMTKRIGWLEGDLPFQIMAINAPFPVPIWRADGFVEAYSWYFRDTDRNLMLVSPDDTAKQVAKLVQSVMPPGEPMVLFGFSQGGYLAPFVAHHLQGVRALVCLGSGYPLDPYKGLRQLKIHAIHGDQDERIPVSSSQAAFARLTELNLQGTFSVVAGLNHRVDGQVEPLVRKLSQSALLE